MTRALGALLLAVAVAGCGGGVSSTATTRESLGDSAAAQLSTVTTEQPQPAAAPTTGASPTRIGERDRPVPAGTASRVGDWEITVLAAMPDATDAVLAENQFNDPPAEGRQFHVVEVAATYRGEQSDTVFLGLSFSAVGPSAVAYGVEDWCGVVPGELDELAEVFPGGTITGSLCWSVRNGDVGSLTLVAEEGIAFDAESTFFAIPPEGERHPFSAPTPEPVSAGSVVGTRGNPVPAGVPRSIGHWEITVLSANPTATDLVLAENQFNDPPRGSAEYFLVGIEAAYLGDESGSAGADLNFSAVGRAGVGYGFNSTCGVVPGEFDEFSEVLPGGTVAGNLCWAVAAGDVDSLVLIADAVADAQRLFFEIPVP